MLTTATLTNTPPRPSGPGEWTVTVIFTGNAGEQVPPQDFKVRSNQDINEVNYWADDFIKGFNAAQTASINAKFNAGSVIAQIARPTPAAPTAADIARLRWSNDVMALERLLGLGTFPAGALTDDIAAFKATLNTRYNALAANDRGLASGWLYFRTAGLR